MGNKPRGACPHCVSFMPGGAFGDSDLTSLDNEERKVVRNLRTGIEDSLRLDLLVHGRYREGRTVCARLRRSSGGLMMVVYFRSFRFLH